MTTVFISYSHKDEEWKDRLVTHLGVLEKEGLLDLWDDRKIESGDDWRPEIEQAINRATIAILMVSANFLTSKFILDEEVPKFLARREKEGLRVIPLIVKPCAWTEVKWLSKIQARPKDGKPLSTRRAPQADGDLAAFAKEIAGMVRRTETREVSETSRVWRLPPDKISLAKLPSTDPTLFGRDDYLNQLDSAWQSPITNPQLPKVNILSLVAWGGVGKTALVNKWLLQMGRDNYRGAERVYGWSFYSQGAAEGRQVSADQFIAAALTWFGDPDPTQGSPWDKGERLAELIKAQRTLLILDGLEPLQSPPPVETGKIKDPGLTSLLRELASQNPGLVVISTRLAVDDLKDFVIASDGRVGDALPPYRDRAKQSPRGEEIASTGEHRLAMTGTMLEIDLDSLSDESGAAYLKHLGVDGTDAERQQASHDFGGHALALTLLGRYLKVVHNGDIRKRGEIPHVMDEQKQGAHARRVMESYERWLQGKPELDILRLMGLFDRPAEKGALDALRKEPAIPSLTDALQKLSDTQWKYAVNNLRELRLLAPSDVGRVAVSDIERHIETNDETLDCHPLLREHFGEKLKAENIKVWQEAHGRLYEYYKTAAKEFPDTLEEMAPLFAAVMHGCQAGLHEETLSTVYYQRIQRQNKYFNLNELGAFGTDLSLISCFFEQIWKQPVLGLSEESTSLVLAIAGFNLSALGRTLEATQPTQTAFEMVKSMRDWTNATRYAINLSQSYFTVGNLNQSLYFALQSIDLANHDTDTFHRRGSRSNTANVMRHLGRFSEAENYFLEAEDIQKKSEPNFQILYGEEGRAYCDFLLSQGKYFEVEQRAVQTIEWAREYLGALYVAGDNLTLGRAHLLQSQHEPNHPFTESLTYLNRAVDGLRQAGDQTKISLGLLARAEYYRLTGDLVKSQKDVDEAFTIATRGGMGLHLADCHLEYARLNVAKSKASAEHSRSVESQTSEARPSTFDLRQESSLAEARKHLATAKEMINRMGYHRRDKEVQELEEQLKNL